MGNLTNKTHLKISSTVWVNCVLLFRIPENLGLLALRESWGDCALRMPAGTGGACLAEALRLVSALVMMCVWI